MDQQNLIIADSDVALVELLAHHFRGRGYAVTTAYDAHTVLKLVHLQTPDAFVLGIEMKCDNGLCVCELLSSERRFSYLPAVLLTAQHEDRYKHDCHGLCAVYATKGEGLARRVETALAQIESHEPAIYAAT
ncbi:MAG: response regulator [Planctomycetia bacterium]|nr:response regulator [Planctomycetia bacterium]